MPQNNIVVFVVPKTYILVSNINGLIILVHETKWVWNGCSPKNRDSFFLETIMFNFETCNRGFSPKKPQNCRNVYATVPKTGFLILKINILLFWGHALLCAFSAHETMHECATCNMLTKK